MSNKKIHVVGNSLDYANWLYKIGYTLTGSVESADLVMFTGGEDVCPHFYNEKKGCYTSFNRLRDEEEQKIFTKALTLKKAMIGVCRGNQFLSVMNGAKLIQHMNHPSRHTIETIDGEKLEVTSSHHQMVFPYNLKDEDYQIIGYTDISDVHLNGDDKQIDMSNKKDVEIIYFPKTKCLGIQSHPEWQSPNSDTVIYLQKLVEKLFNTEKLAYAEN